MQLIINVHSAEELRELSELMEVFERNRYQLQKRNTDQMPLPLEEVNEVPAPEVEEVTPAEPEVTETKAVPTVVEMRHAGREYAAKHGNEAARKLLEQFGGSVSKIESDEQKIAFMEACA